VQPTIRSTDLLLLVRKAIGHPGSGTARDEAEDYITKPFGKQELLDRVTTC